jgi:hypothetical protein
MGARPAAHLVLLAAAAALLGACGGLDTPDVSTGEVSGRLLNVKRAASTDPDAPPLKPLVYVLGKPELFSEVGDDGSYRIANVPAGPATKLVFYDGGEPGSGRAQVVAVEVRGASRTRVDKGDEMPLAARVVVLPRAAGGCDTAAAEVTLAESDLRRRRGDRRGRVDLFPVPEGEWDVQGALEGFRPEVVRLAAAAGSETALELDLDEPEDSAERRGCVSAGCSAGLSCDRDDGRCYECANDEDCGAGAECEDHVCLPHGTSGGLDRDVCQPCASDAQCGVDGVCLAAGGTTGGLCASAAEGGSNDQPCDAGFLPATVSGRAVCVPPGWSTDMRAACTAVVTTFGEPCFGDAACAAALAGGVCAKPAGAGPTTPGVCSAPCRKDSDCPNHIGFRTCSAGLCARDEG